MLRRRKNEGFEWREYVRTTILVRRKERRQRVEDVKVAAVEGFKDAGRKGIEVSAKGAKSASERVTDLIRRTGTALAAAARGAGPAARTAGGRSKRAAEDSYLWLRDRLVPILGDRLAALRTPSAYLILKSAALGLGLLAALRALQFGLDTDTKVALWLAAAAAAVYGLVRVSDPDPATEVPSLSAKLGALLSGLPGLHTMTDRARGGALLGLIVLGIGGAFAWREAPTMSQMTGVLTTGSTSAPVAPPAAFEGRATAVTGSTLKLQGATIVLEGIEAPEMEQICRKPGGSWRCGEAAKQDLADKVRGKRITCTRLGETQDGLVRARCEAGAEDLAKSLVAKGAVFAAGGLFASYSSEEDQAKEKRVGLWAGDNARPDDYRAKRWDEAKKQAPEGCPIKGRVRSGNRVYVLPWSPSYDTVRINTTKGERWFCTEDEAIAAGWRKAASL